jgi:hypothetical protein
VFYELDPKAAERGHNHAIRTLWGENHQGAGEADYDSGTRNSEDEVTRGAIEFNELFELAPEIESDVLERAM